MTTVDLDVILFDIGDTLVRAAAPGTPVADLRAEPIGDVVHELAALGRHYRLGAVTDTATMGADDVRAALAGSGIGEQLEVIITSSDIGAAKPDPQGIAAALAQLGAMPEQALFVGDSDVDEGAARSAGVHFVRVAEGASAGAAVRSFLTDRAGAFEAARALVGPIDVDAAATATSHQDQLTKPRGALGRLEELGIQLAGIAGIDPPPVPRPAAVAVFAADHGVVASGVTPWPQEVTGQMVANFVGGGAAINVLARQAGASVTVVDVGVATDLDALGLAGAPGLRRCAVRGRAPPTWQGDRR